MSHTREEFVGHVGRMIGAHPNWRYGQTVFNVAYTLYPDRVDQLRGGLLDPFYHEERVDAFLDAIFGGSE